MDFKKVFFDQKDYSITDHKVGEGSFGTVYIAENKQDGKKYAAKIIKVKDEIDGNDQMLIMRESTILSALHHPNIVEFMGVNFRSLKDPSLFQPTIITEYLPKQSLKIILDNEKRSISDPNWNPTKKYICLLGISDAMRYLHEHGILHRDLKPENILMDDDLLPRVCDFGLSRCFPNSLSQSQQPIQINLTTQIGTPLYMAPEIFSSSEYGPGVDVYAFAILAYEIITGKEPYADLREKISSFALLKKIENGERPKFFDNFVPDNMKDLIEKCWDQDQEKRPSFSDIFKMLSEDFSYSPESVDEDEVNDFLDMIKSNQKSSEKVKVENKVKVQESEKSDSSDDDNNGNEVTSIIKGFFKDLKEDLENTDNVLDLFKYACEECNGQLLDYLLTNELIDVNTNIVFFLLSSFYAVFLTIILYNFNLFYLMIFQKQNFF